MAERNLLCTTQTPDLEIEPSQSRLRPELSVLGNTMDLTNPHVHPVFPASGNATNLDMHHLSDHHDTSISYGNRYNNIQSRHHSVPNLDVGGVAPSGYNPYMVAPSISRIYPMPLNHASSEHEPSLSNHGVSGVGINEYGRNNHLMDNLRESCKRKNAEGVPGNYHCLNDSTSLSSSSMGIPVNSAPQLLEEPFEPGVGLLDTVTITPTNYRGSNVLSITEGPQRSVRSRSNGINLQMDSALSYHHNHILQGNYSGQSFWPSGSTWGEQFGSNGGEAGNSNWNYAPPMPHLHGRNVNGGLLEIGNMNRQGYQDPGSSRNSAILLHPSSLNNHHHYHLPPMQGMRGSNYSYHPQQPAPSYRQPADVNLHHNTINSSRDGLESGSRYPRHFPSSGDRIYRPHRRISHTASEDINGRMRLLSPEDVAIIEFSGFYGAGNFIDQYRDMRLDIDNMSYEELLALEERIGDVKTGLSEESISKCLKTRLHSCRVLPPMNQPSEVVEDNGTCIICQVEYAENEKIGSLDCGHDYHAECIKQWLLLKNICPICKMSALPIDDKD